jgi:hypothetical protein
MIRHSLIAFLMMIELLAAAQLVEAADARNLDRATIRSMPITQRPYRFGHVYGNNVRRVHKITH